MGVIRNIKQSRRWCWQDKDITDFIRKNFHGQRLTTALAIYLSLTELASNNGSDEFTAYYAQIAKLSGKSLSTAKSYCNQFIRLKILKKENRRIDDKTNLSNQWSLLNHYINNNYQTSKNDYYPTSVEDSCQLLEENELEQENKNEVKNIKEILKSTSYKRLRNEANKLRRGINA